MRDNPQINAFLAHSFDEKDRDLLEYFRRILSETRISVHSATSPWAGTQVPAKIKAMIDDADCFIALFTRKNRIAGKKSCWGCSPYVISEAGYALHNRKPIVILKEKNVEAETLLGDIEYIEFEREKIYKTHEKTMQYLENLSNIVNNQSLPLETIRNREANRIISYKHVVNFELFDNQFLAANRLRDALINSRKLNVIALSGHSILATPAAPLYLLLQKKVSTGSFQMNVAIMSNGPSNMKNIEKRAVQINESPENISKKIEAAIEGYRTLRDKHGLSVEIRSYNAPLFWRYFGYDSEVFISYYFGDVHSLYQKMLAFKRQEGMFFDIFEKFFEAFWAVCKPLD